MAIRNLPLPPEVGLAAAARQAAPALRTVPERVCQAENGFPSGFCAKVAMGEMVYYFCLRARTANSACGYLCQFFSTRLGCRRCGKLQSFFSKGDCSQHIPSRCTAHDNREQLCLVIGHGRCGFILVRIPRRKGHSNHSVVRPGFAIAGPSRRIQGPTSSWPEREGSQVAWQLRSNNQPNLWLVLSPFWLECGSSIMQLTWAEDRALLWKQPERPTQLCCGSNPSESRGQDRMGRHDAALCHSGLAAKR